MDFRSGEIHYHGLRLLQHFALLDIIISNAKGKLDKIDLNVVDECFYLMG